MVNDAHFKFDVLVSRDSPDLTLYEISEKGAWPESRDSVNFTWRIYALPERLLVFSFLMLIVGRL